MDLSLCVSDRELCVARMARSCLVDLSLCLRVACVANEGDVTVCEIHKTTNFLTLGWCAKFKNFRRNAADDYFGFIVRGTFALADFEMEYSLVWNCSPHNKRAINLSGTRLHL